MSKYWTVVVPGVLGGAIFYAYSEPGYLGSIVRSLVDPLLDPVLRFAAQVFHLL